VPVIAGENAMETGTWQRVKTTFWQLDYTFTPCGRYRVGSAARPWRKRDAHTSHLYPPGTVVWEDTLSPQRQPFHFAFVNFRGEVPFLRKLTQNRLGFGRFLDPEGQLGALLSAVAKIADRLREAGFWQAQGRLCEAVELLRRAEPVEEGLYRFARTGTETEETELSRAVEACLRRNLSKPPSAAALARELNMGISTLLHRYRRETGKPLMKQLMCLRLAAARNLLLQGHAVKNVTRQLGFCDDAHFSKSFRRLEGLSPSAFVRASREPAGDQGAYSDSFPVAPKRNNPAKSGQKGERTSTI
jgi:AraC-like DNA-binding protein